MGYILVPISSTRHDEALDSTILFLAPVCNKIRITLTKLLAVGGDVLLLGTDCAENIAIAEGAEVEPGTVMVVGPHGALEPSSCAYDKRVAGVVSGAGEFRSGIVLMSAPRMRDACPLS